MAWKGRYTVKNPAKYKGDPTKVIYRSSLELKFMNFLDTHSDVLEWNSEEVVVPYRCVTDNKMHRYFVDFWFKKRTPDGKIESILVEIKPLAQTREPKKQQRRTRRYINEVMTWGKTAEPNLAQAQSAHRTASFVTPRRSIAASAAAASAALRLGPLPRAISLPSIRTAHS